MGTPHNEGINGASCGNAINCAPCGVTVLMGFPARFAVTTVLP